VLAHLAFERANVATAINHADPHEPHWSTALRTRRLKLGHQVFARRIGLAMKLWHGNAPLSPNEANWDVSPTGEGVQSPGGEQWAKFDSG
jgi:hypothetical protein